MSDQRNLLPYGVSANFPRISLEVNLGRPAPSRERRGRLSRASSTSKRTYRSPVPQAVIAPEHHAGFSQPPGFTMRSAEAGYFSSILAGRMGRATSSPPQF